MAKRAVILNQNDYQTAVTNLENALVDHCNIRHPDHFTENIGIYIKRALRALIKEDDDG